MKKVEIMAPVGSMESFAAALQAGADSVYFGLGRLNMRSQSSQNFTLEDLNTLVTRCQEAHVHSYVTLNSILYDEDLPEMRTMCEAIAQSGATAIIASDIAVLEYARSLGLNVHISTQQNISNLEAVRFFSKYADVMVLARELTLEQIRTIKQGIIRENIRGPSHELVQIELFVHGAMCVSISGKCYMSLMQHHESANRGGCLQPCRRKYRVIDEQTQNELVLDNQYIMSPKDINTIKFVDKLIEAGVSVFKIEGRGRSPEYVKTVVQAYKEAVESVYAGTYTAEKAEGLNEQLKRVYNRGFWEGGYYLGKRLGEWSGHHGSKATTKKRYLGKVTNYFSHLKVAEVLLEAGSLTLGNEVIFIGPTSGVIETTIESIHLEGPVTFAEKGSLVSIPVPEKVRLSDKLYIVEAGA